MEKKLYRSKLDRKLTGVCGGIAKYFGLDSKLVRIITAVLCLFYGIGLVAYILAALLLPEDPTEVIDFSYPEEPYGSKAEPTELPETPAESSGSRDSNSNTNNYKKY